MSRRSFFRSCICAAAAMLLPAAKLFGEPALLILGRDHTIFRCFPGGQWHEVLPDQPSHEMIEFCELLKATLSRFENPVTL